MADGSRIQYSTRSCTPDIVMGQPLGSYKYNLGVRTHLLKDLVILRVERKDDGGGCNTRIFCIRILTLSEWIVLLQNILDLYT